MSCICVLGMHRSGTSCLTGILQGFGVNLGDVHVHNPFNTKGNREHPDIMALNDDVLLHNGGAWNHPTSVQRWTDQQRERRSQIIDSLASAGTPHWGFKDPRTLFTLPFWMEGLLPQHHLLFVGTFRHPVQVAQSLRHRNKYSWADSYRLWTAYNQQLLSTVEQQDVPLVNFDLPPDQYVDEACCRMTALGLDQNQLASAASFFDDSLRHQKDAVADAEPMPAETRAVYEKLVAIHAAA